MVRPVRHFPTAQLREQPEQRRFIAGNLVMARIWTGMVMEWVVSLTEGADTNTKIR
jgi:hypothetical protein